MKEEDYELYLKKSRESCRKSRANNPEKYKANNAVNNALRDGKLSKPLVCEHCQLEKTLEGHHHSYEEEFWLDVVWLCRSCHVIEHKRLNEISRNL